MKGATFREDPFSGGLVSKKKKKQTGSNISCLSCIKWQEKYQVYPVPLRCPNILGKYGTQKITLVIFVKVVVSSLLCLPGGNFDSL